MRCTTPNALGTLPVDDDDDDDIVSSSSSSSSTPTSSRLAYPPRCRNTSACLGARAIADADGETPRARSVDAARFAP
eukprot:31318-Pelagococcus_subviridis.AAC.6